MSKQTVEGFFYSERDVLTRKSAERILDILVSDLSKFSSVLDVGCGVGTWLSVASQMGASKLVGIEGPWLLEETSLVVDRSCILTQNLESPWSLEQQFDLGICLEVAEHLSESAGRMLVSNLSKHCKVILFSAAIPGQAGNGHINLQWPGYWQKLFASHGLEAIDMVRPKISIDNSIPWWYRQNCVVFVSKELASHYYAMLAANPEKRANNLLEIRLFGSSSMSLGAGPTSILRRILHRFAGNS